MTEHHDMTGGPPYCGAGSAGTTGTVADGGHVHTTATTAVPRAARLETADPPDSARMFLEVGLKCALPKGMSFWELIIPEIPWVSLASRAARLGLLPSYFTDWELPAEPGSKSKRTVAHMAAEAGKLPCGFAHEAAMHGRLPEGFDRWDMRDNLGRTVAHMAATFGNLPPDFADWSWPDGGGDTVAYYAACRGRLPKGFSDWDAIRRRRRPHNPEPKKEETDE